MIEIDYELRFQKHQLILTSVFRSSERIPKLKQKGIPFHATNHMTPVAFFGEKELRFLEIKLFLWLLITLGMFPVKRSQSLVRD